MHEVLWCSDYSAFTAGSMQAYFCDPGVGAWARAQTYNDFTIPTSTGQHPDSGYYASTGPELQVLYPFGRFIYVSSGAACAGASWDGGITSTLARVQQ
jgi:hypothetical protein